MGRPMEAEPILQDALATRKQLAADFPTQPEFRQELANTYNSLGVLFRDTKRLKEAEAAYQEAVAVQKQLADDFSAQPHFREVLASSYNNLGVLLREMGRPKEAETAGQEALAAWRQLVAAFPNQPNLRNSLAGSCVNLALGRLDQRDFKAAKAYLDEAGPHLQSALKANPKNRIYQQFYRNSLAVLVKTNAGLGDPVGANAAAEKMRDLAWDPLDNAYNAACYLSLCIPIVQKDDKASKEQRDKQARFYADEAMKILRYAVAKGWKDAAEMRKDTDLDPLRQRDDFKKLLAEVEANAKGKPAVPERK
jgi:tetratricopeptide (TPR) repeat protein